MHGCASDERFGTGFIQEISESRIELDLRHTGMYSYIGFLCEPETCKTTNNYSVGDEVLLTLGSVDNKNKLLSIRKCLTSDPQCNKVKELDIKEEAERKRQSEIFFEKHRACRAKMNTDIANKNSYFPDNEIMSKNSNAILEKYNSMSKQPEYKECLSGFVKSYQDAVLEACLKHGCGQNIGGGCYHIVGYSITTSVLEKAIEQCSI
jgi:hypothetical protein